MDVSSAEAGGEHDRDPLESGGGAASRADRARSALARPVRAAARQRRARRIAAPALIVLGALFLLLGELQLYAARTIFDSEDFARRATSTLEEPEVRSFVAARVTDEIVGASPDLVAARPLIDSATDAIVGSAPFASLFRVAVQDLHRSVFDEDKDTVTLGIADSGVLVIDALRQLNPEIAGKIPKDVEADLVSISSGSASATLNQVARTAEENRAAAPWNLAWAVVLFGLGILAALERRRAVKRIGIALAVVGVVVVAGYEIGRAILVGRLDGAEADAAGAAWDTFLLDLRTWNLVLAGAGIVLALAAASLIRPVDVSAQLRRGWGLAARVPARPLPRGLRAVGLVAVGALILWQHETLLRLAVLAAGLFVLYLGVAELLRMSMPASAAGEPPPPAGRTRRAAAESPIGRRIRAAPLLYLAILAAVLIAGGVALAALATGDDELDAGPIRACNGAAELCDRPLDEVSFPSTHNSMSAATEPGWLFAQQNTGLRDQLDAGIRGLLIDTHYGVATDKGVATELQAGSKSRAKIADELGEEFVDTAERLRGRLGYEGGGDPEVFLCHAYCEVGATKGLDALRDVRDWLVQNPHEVLVISIEDDVTPEDTAALFEQSGLLDYVYMGEVGPPWPTPREMIESGQRVLVMGENEVGEVPWYHQQFELTQETPFHFTSPEELADPDSCDPNRGGADASLLLLNHWVDTSPAPKPSNAKKVNAYDALLKRAERCQRARGLLPNLVAVDFYREGDLGRVVETLNGLGAEEGASG